jgi:hypothetical protein
VGSLKGEPMTRSLRRPSRAYIGAALVAAVVASSGRGRAEGRPDGSDVATERPRVGVVEGLTKLSLALEYARVGDQGAVRVGGDFEHMLRNRWGLVGSLSIPVSGPWVVPGTMGMRVHANPGGAFDPFFGAAGGFAWVNPTNRPADVVPMLAMRLGLTWFTTGIYFLQLDGGYDFVRYSHAGIGFDLGGPVLTGRVGFDF